MSERSMDGISTVRIGAIGLAEQKEGGWWAAPAPGVDLDVQGVAGAKVGDKDAYMATISLDEESIIGACAATPHDAAEGAYSELLDLYARLTGILGFIDPAALGGEVDDED